MPVDESLDEEPVPPKQISPMPEKTEPTGSQITDRNPSMFDENAEGLEESKLFEDTTGGTSGVELEGMLHSE